MKITLTLERQDVLDIVLILRNQAETEEWAPEATTIYDLALDIEKQAILSS